MSKVAFLGLGAMGSRMAANLLNAGHDLTVWNRSQKQPRDVLPPALKQRAAPESGRGEGLRHRYRKQRPRLTAGLAGSDQRCVGGHEDWCPRRRKLHTDTRMGAGTGRCHEQSRRLPTRRDGVRQHAAGGECAAGLPGWGRCGNRSIALHRCSRTSVPALNMPDR